MIDFIRNCNATGSRTIVFRLPTFPFLDCRADEYGLSGGQSHDASDRAVDSHGVHAASLFFPASFLGLGTAMTSRANAWSVKHYNFCRRLSVAVDKPLL